MFKNIFFVFLFSAGVSFGQTLETAPPEYIKTIEFKGKEEFSGTPLLKLGQTLTLEFDDLIGDETDYYYKIKHFNFDWTPSELSRNEYLSGFDDLRIKDYKNSRNTLQIYTHYQLKVPNKDTRKFKVSGNYMLEIYNDDDEMVFSRRFIVYEDLVAVPTEIKRSRDLNFIESQQVVNFSIQTDEHFPIKNPDQTLQTLLVQNKDFQNSIYDLKPQYRMGNELIYKYDKETSFGGGNEFLHFDSKNVRGTDMNIQTIELEDIYNIYLYADVSRHNDIYTYNPDINGNFKINTLQGEDKKTESEYTRVYFSLKDDRDIGNSEVHIYGGFNNFVTDESTQLTYNKESQRYEGHYLFKQGFYDYKYILKDPEGNIDYGFFSGDFDKTENEYSVIIYYRDPGERYDRVIGIGTASSRDISD